MSAVWFIGFSLAWTALLYGAACLVLRGRVSARFAHNSWRAVAGLTALPWLIAGAAALLPTPLGSPIPDVPYLGGAVGAISETAAVQAAARTAANPIFGLVAWAVLAGGWGVRLLLNACAQIRLQAIKSGAKPTDALAADAWAARLGLSRAPRVAVIDTGSPFLAGLRERTIYLPRAVSDAMHANIIFAHECTHLARGDLVSRPFERLVADIFWFSPFAWMLRQQLDYWREAACDEQTAQLTGDSVAYARVLADTARLTRPAPRFDLPVAAFILPQRETLKKRLTQLLDAEPARPRRKLTLLTLAAGFALAPLSLAQGTGLVSAAPVFTHPVIADASARITMPFGDHSKPGKTWWHSGVDIAAPKYTYVHAPGDATVLWVGEKPDYGLLVDVKFEDGSKMRFAQLAHSFVHKGQTLQAGEKIGKVGASGVSATGPHLHLELFRDGEHADPQACNELQLIQS